MQSFRVRLVSLAIVTLAAASAHAQPAPSHTGGSRPGLDVLEYNFRVEFPATAFPDTIRFIATTTATRTATVTRLSLDLVAAMRVDSVLVDAHNTPFTRTGDSVSVALGDAASDTVRVAVYYRGSPADGLIIRRDSTLGWTAFGDNFPDRARQWLAVVDHPSDKALVEWDVVAPMTHRVIANGALIRRARCPPPGRCA